MSVLSMSSSQSTSKPSSVNGSISLTPLNTTVDPYKDKTQKHFDTFKHSIFQKLNYISHSQAISSESKDGSDDIVIDESTLLNYIINPDALNQKILSNNLYLNNEVQTLKKKLNDMIIMNTILDDHNKKLSDEFTAMKLEKHLAE